MRGSASRAVVLGLSVAALGVAAAAQAQPPPAGAVPTTEAQACILICLSGMGGAIGDEGQKKLFQQCTARNFCATKGPERPVAREPTDLLRTRPLDILRGTSQDGRV